MQQTRRAVISPEVRLADLIIRGPQIYSMSDDRAVYRSMAIRDGRIVAVGPEPEDLDRLATSGTASVDASDLTLLPAFYDAHEHLFDAAQNLSLVQPSRAKSIGELMALIRERASATPAGQWVQTSMGWNEGTLAERRLPTAAELDQATDTHPVLVPRGGHTSVANSMALRLAGIDRASADPPGGSIGRLPDGSLSGVLEGSVNAAIKGLIPVPSVQEQANNLEAATHAYAAMGFGTIREALIQRDQFAGYQAAWEQDRLNVRCRVMITVSPLIPLADRLTLVEGLGFRSGFGDDRLRVWGLKFVMDGGVAGSALEQPFADNPGYSGHVNWDIDEFVKVGSLAVSRGWKLATHAVGDMAVRLTLDAYERILTQHPSPAGTLVLEHGILAGPELRARAIKLGVPITVQHYLIYANAAEMLKRWGPERTARAFPLRDWIADGAVVAAGSDSVHPFNPLTSVWGMETRGTRDSGVLGADQAIDRVTAIDLYTRAAARFGGDGDRLGTLEAGRLADCVAYDFDPMTVPVDKLSQSTPVLTMIGGRPSFDPHGRIASSDRLP